MRKINVGDRVRFLNSVGGGVVKGFQDKNLVIVEDEHGFDFPILISECVVVKSSENEKLENVAIERDDLDIKHSLEVPQIAEPVGDSYEETAEGEKITSCLVYLPTDIKTLSTNNFECFFVNDSNYYLFVNYMNRQNNAWQTRYTGLIEPNTQLFLEEFDKSQLNEMEQVCVQYIAFKHNKSFGFKTPVSVELRIDPVKFYKLHSFKENDYFQDDALVYYITRRDQPQRELVLSSQDIQQAIREKSVAERRPRRERISKKEKKEAILEVDLHIHELLDTTAGLSNQDMLDYQMKKFYEVITENKKHKNKKIVFIHGKGDGVLKSEIIKALKKNFKQYDYQDASFQEYGYGATMVIIK